MLQFTGARVRSVLFLLFAAALLSFLPADHAYAERPYKRCTPDEVHPIWWKAEIRYDEKVKIRETRSTETLEKGTKVTVVSSNVTGAREIMLKDGTHCSVPQSALYIYEDEFTPGEYTKATKLNFVNSRRITSETDYMIWVSTDMQSLNVFTGYNRHWQLVKSFKCSSGMAGYSTPLGSRRIVAKMPVCHSDQWDSNLQYFLSFGGSGIHKWPGSGAGENLGVRPCSHGCVRLGTNAAIWMFKHIPVNTRFLVY